MKGRTGGLAANRNNNQTKQPEQDNLVKKVDMRAATLGDIFSMHTQQLGGLEDGKLTKLNFQKFLFMEQVCFSFNLLGLGLSVIQYDLEFDEMKEEISTWLLWMIFVSTCFLLLFTIYRYLSHVNWLKSRKQVSQSDYIWNTEDWPYMIIELIVYMGIPLPFTMKIQVPFYNSIQDDYAYYHVNEILALFMISRTIYLFRTVLTLTFWYGNRTQRVCNLYACEGNYMFVAKSLMRTAPYTSQFIALVSLIFIFGYAVRICENPLARNDPANNNLGLYSNALWNIIITITTVGYGDFYTRTDLGRFIIFIVCVLGIFVVSVMVVTLIESLRTTTLESHAITVLERVQLRDILKREAASVITLTAKTSIGWRNGTLNKKQHNYLIVRLKQKLISFKIILRRYKSVQDMGSLNEEITNQFSLLKKDFQELIDRQKLLIGSNQEIMGKLGVEQKIPPSQVQL